MSTPPSSQGTCKCNRKQVKGEYISVHQHKYLQSPSLCHPNVLYAPDLFCAIVILSWNLIFLSPGACMWLFYYTTKFHFLSSAEIKLGLEDTIYKGCSDKPEPSRWGVKPSTLGGQSGNVGHRPELEQAAAESGILGSLLPCGLSHPKETTSLGHTVNQRTPTFNVLLGNTLLDRKSVV